MPWYDVEVHKQKDYFTIEAPNEEEAELTAKIMANTDYLETWTHVEEISMAEMAARKKTIGVN